MFSRIPKTSPVFAMAALCTGFFLLRMDTTVVNVAIPDIRTGLGAGLNDVAWVNSGYLLTFAVPLLLAARLGDRLGRKRVFLAGMGLFTAASLWCTLAATPQLLIVARLVQGVGAAAMAPQPIAFIATLFPPQRRGVIFGVWGTVGAAATTVGPVLGGLLVQALGWRWVFAMNVPIGLVGLAGTVLLVPEVRSGGQHRFDLLGALLSGMGLLAVVFGLQNGQRYRWGAMFGPVTVIEIILAGVLLLIGFVFWQHRGAAQPLLPLGLFRHRNFTAAALAGVAICFALTGLYFPLTLLVQQGLGASPVVAGLLLVPVAVGAGVTGPFAGRFSDRISGKWVVLTGFGVFACGLGALAAEAGNGVTVWALAPALLLCGIGAGTAFAPMANVATADLPTELLGAASGVYNATRQVGSVAGAVVISIVLEARLAMPGAPGGGAMTQAAGDALLLPVALLLLGCLACLAMRGRTRARPGAPTTTSAEDPAHTGH